MTSLSSANFKEIAVSHLLGPVNTIKETFKNRIDITTALLGSKVNEYINGRQLLLDNVEHCTDDKSGLMKGITDNEIGVNYHELIDKYGRYKTDSESIYKQYIHNPVDNIIDTGIDQLEQQDVTRKLFENLRNACSVFAKWITEHRSGIDVEVQDFVGAVDTYVTNKIPVLTTDLIACINRSTNDAENDVRSQYQAINFATPNPLFETGDKDIDEITELLAQLAKLEAAGP
jgi:hypothetical protein